MFNFDAASFALGFALATLIAVLLQREEAENTAYG